MSEPESAAESAGPAEANEQKPNQFLLLLLAWIVPGAGHFALGRRRRALVFLFIVATALTVGFLLDGNLYRIVPNRPLTVLATLACMGLGAPYFGLRFLMGYEGNIVSAGYEYGTAFILTAGLMNLLLILDTLDIAAGRKS